MEGENAPYKNRRTQSGKDKNHSMFLNRQSHVIFIGGLKPFCLEKQIKNSLKTFLGEKKIENLNELTHLKIINLCFNDNLEIVDNLDILINFKNLHIILDLNKRMINRSSAPFNSLKNLNQLNTNNNLIDKIENIENFEKGNIKKIKTFDKSVNLENLQLNNNKITKTQNLDQLINSNTISFHNNNIRKIENVNYLTDLQGLFIAQNQMTRLQNLNSESLEGFEKLNQLNHNRNTISKIERRNALTNSTLLGFLSNTIKEITNLDRLQNLGIFFLNDNQIENVNNIFISKGVGVHLSGNEIILAGQKFQNELRRFDERFIKEIWIDKASANASFSAELKLIIKNFQHIFILWQSKW
ncbi:L domain-like protein [Ascoidea rubescens DSM 1968]|uniref:L domain-like protein n=1 Tax=Ascoidea rubescens DSM 1968 TaxID=1344418 RepID=A0A1D2VKK9_9ASCO|nr:L domain-like protein [Ascoidea rubescens DSM 1968]ODV62139.1 L domain-like protein [Ascoidea rubescens DSM 1968]